MIYIRLEEKMDNRVKNDNYLLQVIYKLKKKYSKLKEEKYENKTLISISDLEYETLEKISNYIKQKCISLVCLSDNLLNNEIFMNFIKNENVRVFDGRWLFKHLTNDVLKYISNMKKEKIELQEVSFLSNDINRIVVDAIKSVSKQVKIVNIITGKESRFRKLEKELYSENGIVLNMNNNYKKSLIKSDIIFNFDFDENDLLNYNLSPKSCIINLNKSMNIDSKKFSGINCSFYTISMPSKYIKSLIFFRGFKTEILYESFIYKNTSPENIKKELKEDKINIISLNSRTGKIRKSEYNNLSKKVAI